VHESCRLHLDDLLPRCSLAHGRPTCERIRFSDRTQKYRRLACSISNADFGFGSPSPQDRIGSDPILRAGHLRENDVKISARGRGMRGIRREMKDSPATIFARPISRRVSSRRGLQLRAALLAVVAYANMPGRGDVTSGVSFFAACTYHPRARVEERAGARRAEEARRSEREEDKDRLSTPTPPSSSSSSRACCVAARQMRSHQGPGSGARRGAARRGAFRRTRAPTAARNYDSVTTRAQRALSRCRAATGTRGIGMSAPVEHSG